MHSLANLNVYSDLGVEFTDDRPINIVYRFENSVNKAITIDEDTTHSAQVGNEILEFVNCGTGNVVYQINVAGLANTTVTWDSLPANITSNSSAGVYSLYGLNTVRNWELVKSPTITMPNDYSGVWTYTSSLLLNGNVDTSWTTTVTVNQIDEITQPAVFYYVPGETETVLFTPVVQDTTSNSYTLTAAVSNTAVVSNLTVTGTGGTVTTNATAKSITITASRSQINNYLANLSITTLATSEVDFYINYGLYNPVNTTWANVSQGISSLNENILTRGNAITYNEDVAVSLADGPDINDPYGNVGQSYFLRISAPTANSVSNIYATSSQANVTYYSGNVTFALDGTKAQINSTLANVFLTPGVDYAQDFNINYTLSPVDTYLATDINYPDVELLLQANVSTTGNIVDGSVNNYTPITSANVTVSNAQAKWGTTSFYFDGNAYVGYNNVTNLQPTADFTWEAWVYPLSGQTYPTVLGYGAFGPLELLADFSAEPGSQGYATGSWRINISRGGPGSLDVYYAATSTMQFNSWQHLAVVRSDTSLKLYVNGQAVISTSITGNITNTGNLTIGSYAPVTGSNNFKGYMDDVRFTRGVARYLTNFTAPTSRFGTGEFSPVTSTVSATRIQPLLINAVNDEIANISITRSYVENTPALLFTSSVPSIIETPSGNPTYTINFTSSAGEFGLSDNNTSSNFSYSGTKAQCNTAFGLIKFYPNRDAVGNYTITYRQFRSGVLQLTQTFAVNGSARTTPLPDQGVYTFVSNSSFVPTYTQAKYLDCIITLVGGGGGGATCWTPPNFADTGGGGGGGGMLEANVSGISNNLTYPVIIGQGGEAAILPYDVAGVTYRAGAGGNTTVFGYTAVGGGAGGVRNNNARGGNTSYTLNGTVTNYIPGELDGGAGAGGLPTGGSPNENGGIGRISWITGEYYAGGGGSGEIPDGERNFGGTGGGADGGIGGKVSPDQPPINAPQGTNGRGGGGGGGYGYTTFSNTIGALPSAGGSGVAIIKFYR